MPEGDGAVRYTLPDIGELFYRVSSVIPEEQVVRCVTPDTLASEALEIMREFEFSQLPVISGPEVLGVFSYRSFSEGILVLHSGRVSPGEVPVEEAMQPVAWVRSQDELGDIVSEFERSEAVLVGDEQHLQAIVTAADVARFYGRTSQPFVLIGEIERTMRALIRASVDTATIAEHALQALAEIYADRDQDPPIDIERMTTGELVRLVVDGRFWNFLGGAFGQLRDRAAARLRSLPGLRNDVFHFKRPLSEAEFDELQDTRDWLLRRLRAVRGEGG
jgi:predicted transcriptional regulator